MLLCGGSRAQLSSDWCDCSSSGSREGSEVETCGKRSSSLSSGKGSREGRETEQAGGIIIHSGIKASHTLTPSVGQSAHASLFTHYVLLQKPYSRAPKDARQTERGTE